MTIQINGRAIHIWPEEAEHFKDVIQSSENDVNIPHCEYSEMHPYGVCGKKCTLCIDNVVDEENKELLLAN